MFQIFRENVKKRLSENKLTYSRLSIDTGIAESTIKCFMCGANDSRRIAEKIADEIFRDKTDPYTRICMPDKNITVKTIWKKSSDTDTPKDPTPIGTMGDIDGDGKITSADSLLILRASVKLENFTDNQNKLADVDKDGNISSSDAPLVLRYSVGFKDNDYIGKVLTE